MPEPVAATLLVQCPDRPGLVAALSTFVAVRGGNILAIDQHVEVESSTFFMRIVWDLARFNVPRAEVPAAVATLCEGEGLAYSLSFSDVKPRTAVLVSKSPHCLYDLLLNEQLGELSGEIVLVVSNHNDLRSVAEHFGKPFEHVPTEDRAAAEMRHRELLAGRRVDGIVLARYMQILSPGFVTEWSGRVINIHHSFLPAFVGAEAYRQAKERGVKMIGATAHYVTADLDQGPIIDQQTVRVSHRDSLSDVVRKGHDLERQVLSRAVRLHHERRVMVSGNRTIVFE